jgi:hypothetical protein
MPLISSSAYPNYDEVFVRLGLAWAEVLTCLENRDVAKFWQLLRKVIGSCRVGRGKNLGSSRSQDWQLLSGR